ncbi:MAG: WecB/TagA/CpsF family glycosyltransferase [Patescibacteria group bacterium]
MQQSTITILDVKLDCGTFNDMIARCKQWLTESPAAFHRIVTINPEFVMEAQDNMHFREVLNSADLRVTDGVGLVFGSLFLKGLNDRLHRCTGVDLTWKLAELCYVLHKKMYLIGASDGMAKNVAQSAARVIEKKYPGVIVGALDGLKRGGEESDSENEYVSEQIRTSQADVLLVAIGAPKQDLWLARYGAALPTVRIALGAGGTLDYIAGVVPRAPRAIRKLGFEWLYRLINQPRRLNRIITATVRYPLALMRQKFH